MCWQGPFRGLVVNNSDPEGLNRIRVQVPQVLGTATSGWALPIPVDVWQTPAVGAQVLVTFEGGDLSHPLYYADSVGVSKSYIDSGDASTLSSAKSYADSGDSSTLTSAENFATTGDNNTLASAKSYADTGDSNTLASAHSYSDTGDSNTLSTSETYTNNQVANRAVVPGGDLGGTPSAPTVVSGAHHTHTSSQISDATTAGKSVLTVDTGWINLTFPTGYVGDTTDVPKARQTGDRVEVVGTVRTQSGSNFSGSAVVANIPAGIPFPLVGFPVALAGSTGSGMLRGFPDTDGSITVTASLTGSCNYVSLKGISYRTT